MNETPAAEQGERMPESLADSFQLSPQQERLWAREPQGPSARTQAVLAIEGQADMAAVAEALRSAASRHESLRTTFAPQPGLTFPLQVVNSRLEPRIETIDISAADPDEQRERLRALLRSELQAPFDLEQGPLVRAVLVGRDRQRIDVIVTLSALCADHLSASLLLGELAGKLASVDPVEDPLQYADFSAWQHELSDSEEDEARDARAFWRELDGTRSPAIPFTRLGAGAGATEVVEAPIDAAVAQALEGQAQRYGVPVAAFAQAGWHAVLGRFAGVKDTTISFLAGERRHPDLEGAMGAFARPVPIQAGVAPDRAFAETVAEIERARGEALVHQDYMPADIPGEIEIGFVEYPGQLPQPPATRLRIERIVQGGQDPRLSLMCAADGQRLRLSIAFDPARHRHETVSALADGLVRTLRAAADDPSVQIADIDMLGEQERRRLLAEFNDTSAAIPRECAHELVARWGLSAPDREAVVDGTGSITYADLDTRANQLAHRLRSLGIECGATVGLCCERSTEMVIGLLGILKAGGAYVPLHHEHPSARLHRQLLSAGASALVTQEALLDGLADFEGSIVCLERDRPELDREPSSAPPPGRASHEDLAYVIYTSGSTGTPKGVQVTHGNLVNYGADIVKRLAPDGEPLSFGLVTSISTDLGNTAVFGALCSGGTLVLVGSDVAADPGALAGLMQARPLDVLKITPSHIGALLAGGEARVLPRRWLVLGGERADWDLIERIRSLASCSILNHYGPSETTIGSCTYVVGESPGEYQPASVPIGRPISNTRCYVLDDGNRLAPVGVAGRLFIAGAGVARGYVDEPEMTAERFSPNPFTADEDVEVAAKQERMYDTGDLARWLPDGALEFLGRADEQVKIRGYRVEPGEVESALRAHPQVREGVVVIQPSAGGEMRLVAYCTVEGLLDQGQLRAHLAEWLPEYMLPGAIGILDELPRTPSGKIDRLALPDPDFAAAQTAEHVAPRTPLEQTVAAIWEQVLGVSGVGLEDDFFALGGHSLLATQVVAQVRSDFAVDLPLHSLFTCPTVASLAAEIVRMMSDSEGDETARLMAELENMSDEEAQRLLAEDRPPGTESG